MTLTVRLDTSIESALERYCADHGVTKSLVVQESLAVYLAAAPAIRSGADAGPEAASPLYKAFEQAGLVGTGELGGVSADKATVRARALQRIRRSSR